MPARKLIHLHFFVAKKIIIIKTCVIYVCSCTHKPLTHKDKITGHCLEKKLFVWMASVENGIFLKNEYLSTICQKKKSMRNAGILEDNVWIFAKQMHFTNMTVFCWIFAWKIVGLLSFSSQSIGIDCKRNGKVVSPVWLVLSRIEKKRKRGCQRIIIYRLALILWATKMKWKEQNTTGMKWMGFVCRKVAEKKRDKERSSMKKTSINL